MIITHSDSWWWLEQKHENYLQIMMKKIVSTQSCHYWHICHVGIRFYPVFLAAKHLKFRSSYQEWFSVNVVSLVGVREVRHHHQGGVVSMNLENVKIFIMKTRAKRGRQFGNWSEERCNIYLYCSTIFLCLKARRRWFIKCLKWLVLDGETWSWENLEQNLLV